MSALAHASDGRSSRATWSFDGVLVALGIALAALSAGGAIAAGRAHPLGFASLLALGSVLVLLAPEVEGRAISVAGISLLTVGFAYGVGAGVCAALVAAAVTTARSRASLRSGFLEAASLALASGAGAGAYHALSTIDTSRFALAPALAAGGAFCAVGFGVRAARSSLLREDVAAGSIIDTRLGWLAVRDLASAVLALGCILLYRQVGIVGLAAATLAPGLLIASMRPALRKTRSSALELERANDELRRSNGDLRDLFDFGAGLAALGNDSSALAQYAQRSLTGLVGGRVEVTVGDGHGEEPTALCSAGRVVGDLVVKAADRQRWVRLEDAVRFRLAAALDGAILSEEAAKTQAATIAALSHTLAAKETGASGGHTDRVAEIAVAVARRLGYSGHDLDAISIGALLHDIGKIGIPTAILHKPGPLDNNEWAVMKRHPAVSEHILSGADLPQIVLEIARSLHERIDGRGYPDGLAGDAIPLPARIVLVAEAFDALTTDRPYRRARRPRAALEEIAAHAGEQFCPSVVAALERVYQEEPVALGEVERLTIVA